MTDIEIGINITAKLYLHGINSDAPIPFDVKGISKVEKHNGITNIWYSSANISDPIMFEVRERKEDIEEAIKDAEFYRNEGLEHIGALLQ